MTLAQIETALSTLRGEDPDTFFLVAANLREVPVASPWFRKSRHARARSDFWSPRNLLAEVYDTPRSGVRWRLFLPLEEGRPTSGAADTFAAAMEKVDALLEEGGFVLPSPETPFENRHRQPSRERVSAAMSKPPVMTGSGASFAEAFASLKAG